MTNDEWIPVSEKLPDCRVDANGNVISKAVIIWRKHNDASGEYDWYDIGFYWPRNDTFETVDENGYFVTICSVFDVKAWLPLPEPYEENGGENA